MMGCPVSELQSRMTSREFSEWIARARIQAEAAEQAEIVQRVESRMKR
tara:strand:- start:8045 stop:8188 length:144 start_codon:yes stop_codon:yes gene_type:complete